MRLRKQREVEYYGREAEEVYRFFFKNSGELESVELKVQIDADGHGYTSRKMIDIHEIDIDDVPSDVREDVNDRLMTSAEAV